MGPSSFYVHPTILHVLVDFQVFVNNHFQQNLHMRDITINLYISFKLILVF